MAKKKQGGQPGNRNARSHGYYSAAFSDAEREIFENALDVDPKELRNEQAVMRATLFQLVQNEPGNVEVIAMLGRTIMRMVALQHGLSQEHQDELTVSFVTLVDDLRRNNYPEKEEATP